MPKAGNTHARLDPLSSASELGEGVHRGLPLLHHWKSKPPPIDAVCPPARGFAHTASYPTHLLGAWCRHRPLLFSRSSSRIPSVRREGHWIPRLLCYTPITMRNVERWLATAHDFTGYGSATSSPRRLVARRPRVTIVVVALLTASVVPSSEPAIHAYASATQSEASALGAPTRDTVGLYLLDQVGGATNAAATTDNTLNARVIGGVGLRAALYDGVGPAARLLGQSAPLPDVIADVTATDGLAVVAAGQAGLRLLSLDTANPQEIGAAFTSGAAVRVAVVSDYAWVATTSGHLTAFDIRDPSQPQERFDYETGVALNDIAAAHGLVAAIDSTTLHLFDASVPSRPRLISRTRVGVDLTAVDLGEAVAWVGSAHDGVLALDVSRPSHPRSVAHLAAGEPVRDVFVGSRRVWLAVGSTVWAYSLSPARSPVAHAVIDLEAQARRLCVAGDRLVVATPDGYLTVDVADIPSRYSVAPLPPAGGLALPHVDSALVHRNVLWMANGNGGLSAWSVEQGASLHLISQLAVGGVPRVASGDSLFVLGLHEIAMVDIDDPTSPRITGAYRSPASPLWDVAADDQYLYVAAGFGGIRVIDASTSSMMEVGRIDLGEPVYGLDCEGRTLYAVTGGASASLVILDVTDPAQLQQVSQLRMRGSGWRVRADNQTVYVADMPRHPSPHLHVVDVTHRGQPRLLAELSIPASPVSLDADGGFVLVGSYHSTGAFLQLIQSPADEAAREVERVAPSGVLEAVALAGDHAFVARGDGGMAVYALAQRPTAVATPPGTQPTATHNQPAAPPAASLVLPLVMRNGAARPIPSEVPPPLQRLGELGARARAVAIARGFVYAGVGSRLAIYRWPDVGSDCQLGEISQTASMGGEVRAVDTAYFDGRLLAYVLTDALHVVDVSDPETPLQIAKVRVGGEPTAMLLDNQRAFVGARPAGLSVVDLSNPNAPALQATVDTPGPVSNLAIADNTVYVAADMLQVVDVTDPHELVSMGFVFPDLHPSDLAIVGDRLWLVDGLVVAVFAIDDPLKPELLLRAGLNGDMSASALRIWRLADRVFLGGAWPDTVEVTIERGDALRVIRALDVEAPVDMAVEGDRLIVAGHSDLVAFELGAHGPTEPPAELITSAPPVDIALARTRAYIVAEDPPGIDIVDIGQPHGMTVLQTITLPGTPRRVAVDLGGKLAAVAADEYVALLDVSNQLDAQLTGVFAMPAGIWGAVDVAISGDEVFVLAEDGTLLVLDVVDPLRPKELARLSSPRPPIATVTPAMAFHGSHIYVTGRGLMVVDVTDPGEPRPLGAVGDNDTEALTVAGGLAFVGSARSTDPSRIYDISQPSVPREIGTVSVPAAATALLAAEVALFVQAEDDMVRVYDIHDPTQVRLLSLVGPTVEHGRGLAWTDGRLLVGGGRGDSDGANRVRSHHMESLPQHTLLGAVVPAFTNVSSVAMGDPATAPLSVPEQWLPPLHGARATSNAASLYVVDSSALHMVALDTHGELSVGDSVPAGWGPPTVDRVRLAVHGTDVWASSQSGLRAFRADAEGDLRQLSTLAEPAHDIALSSQHAYLAQGVDGVVVVELTDPTAPAVVARYTTADSAALSQVAVAGGVLLAGGNRRLHVVDVSHPETPVPLATLDLSAPDDDGPAPAITDISMSGDHAYLSRAGISAEVKRGGVTVVSLSDPSDPHVVADRLDSTRRLSGPLVTSSELLALAVGGHAVELWDVSTPTAAVLVARVEYEAEIESLAIHDRSVGVALGRSGVRVLRCPSHPLSPATVPPMR